MKLSEVLIAILVVLIFAFLMPVVAVAELVERIRRAYRG